MSRITVIFGTLKDGSLLINISASNNYLSNKNIFQNGVAFLSKIDDAFLAKNENFILFGLSDNVQILIACGINTYYGITNGISNFRYHQLTITSIARNNPLQHQPFTTIFHSSSFLFPLLFLAAKFKIIFAIPYLLFLPQACKI